MGLRPANLPDPRHPYTGRVRMTVPGGTYTMNTDEGVGAQIPGNPRDLIVLESDDPIPVTVYSTATNEDGDGRPVSSTELRIEWRIGTVTFVEQWHPVDCVRNLVANHVRVAAVYANKGYTSPRSDHDRVTAWAAPGHAVNPRAAKLWQFPTQVGDPTSGTEPNIIPPFANKFVFLADNWQTNSFFSGPGAVCQFVEGDGSFLASQSRGFRFTNTDVLPEGNFYAQELPPGARTLIWQSGGAAWLGDADWLALKFICDL
jgi:hypothetical protein